MGSNTHSDFASHTPPASSAGMQTGAGMDLFIKLRNADDTGQVWDKSLITDIKIGRDESCHIHLTDKSVSRLHSRIYFNGITMIENLSKTNQVKLNGVLLNLPAALNAGDTFKCGRVSFIVESIYNSGLNDGDDPYGGTRFINV
jgi:pSer/pThr/pTyr-binding forkhead associated (FHA) protein